MNGMISTERPIYIDTNIFIYAVEGVADTAGPSKKLLEALREHRRIAVTSEITLAEVLAPPKRKDALQLRIKKRVYLDLLLWSRVFNLVPVTRGILIETAHLRTVATLKLPDAIHLVTAIRSNCGFFVCKDNDFKKLPAGMKRVRPNMQEIDDLLKVIA